jgi:hypothetical protein
MKILSFIRSSPFFKITAVFYTTPFAFIPEKERAKTIEAGKEKNPASSLNRYETVDAAIVPEGNG